MTNTVVWDSTALDDIARHAEEQAPIEACGLILEGGTYLPCVNAMNEFHERDPESYPRTALNGFVLDSDGASIAAFGLAGERVVAIVHSHPNGLAYLSARDRAGAMSEAAPPAAAIQVVVGVTDGEPATEIASYRWDDATAEYREIARAFHNGEHWVQTQPMPTEICIRLQLGTGRDLVLNTQATLVEDALAAALVANSGSECMVIDPSTGLLRPDVNIGVDGISAVSGQRLASGSNLTVSIRAPSVVGPSATIHDSFISTPLIDVSELFGQQKGTVLIKYEPATPTGSHKYRAARAAVSAAIRSGDLRAGGTIIAPTGGNYGLALLALANDHRVRCTLVLPDNYPRAKIRMLELAGAEVILADHSLGPNAHGLLATEIWWSHPQKYCIFDQFSDPTNVRGHIDTGTEILTTLGSRPLSCLVLGIGSGASLTGIGRTLRTRHQQLRIVGVQPEGCDVLSGDCAPNHGIPGLAVGGPPSNLDIGLVDAVQTVTAADARLMAVGALARAGLNVGISTGANLAAVAQVLADSPTQSTVITLAYDRLDSYLDQL